MSACALSTGEMIERHMEVLGIESQTGEDLLDVDLIDVSSPPFEFVLHRSIADQSLVPFHRVGHFAFESLHFPLHADEVRERLEAHIP
jgi:hypothetical protein